MSPAGRAASRQACAQLHQCPSDAAAKRAKRFAPNTCVCMCITPGSRTSGEYRPPVPLRIVHRSAI